MVASAGEVQRVAEALLARIVGGTYAPGVRLPAEVDIAGELGCGRSTVREALRHLAGLGVVRSRRGSGATVLDFRREGTPALLPIYVATGRFELPVGVLAAELLRTRALLAREAVRVAALYAPPGALGEPRRRLAAAADLAGDPAGHAQNDLELFRALVVASGVWPAVWLANAFWAPLRELLARLAPAVAEVPADYGPQMAKLLQLIERRDAEGAVRHVERWWRRVDERLLERLGALLDGGASGLAATRSGPPLDGAAEPSRGRAPSAARARSKGSPAPARDGANAGRSRARRRRGRDEREKGEG